MSFFRRQFYCPEDWQFVDFFGTFSKANFDALSETLLEHKVRCFYAHAPKDSSVLAPQTPHVTYRLIDASSNLTPSTVTEDSWREGLVNYFATRIYYLD